MTPPRADNELDEIFMEQWFIDRVKAGPDQLRIYNYASNMCFTTDLNDVKQALLEWRDKSIREARIDELKELQMSTSITDDDKDVLWENYIQYRVAELSNQGESND